MNTVACQYPDSDYSLWEHKIPYIKLQRTDSSQVVEYEVWPLHSLQVCCLTYHFVSHFDVASTPLTLPVDNMKSGS